MWGYQPFRELRLRINLWGYVEKGGLNVHNRNILIKCMYIIVKIVCGLYAHYYYLDNHRCRLET